MNWESLSYAQRLDVGKLEQSMISLTLHSLFYTFVLIYYKFITSAVVFIISKPIHSPLNLALENIDSVFRRNWLNLTFEWSITISKFLKSGIVEILLQSLTLSNCIIYIY
jgi:hypothetical protein